MLASEPEGVEGGFVREFMLLLDGFSVEGQSTGERESGLTPVISVTRLSVLCQHITSKTFGRILAMCLSARVVARSSTPTTASTDTKERKRKVFVSSRKSS